MSRSGDGNHLSFRFHVRCIGSPALTERVSMSIDRVFSVVLCGGSGSRLWPISRDAHPKQLLSLDGGDSLLQGTLTRIVQCPSLALAQTLVVCQEAYRFVIAHQLEAIGHQARIILEPVGRNTAPALSLAALQALEGGEDAVLVVMPSDHVLSAPDHLDLALQRAISLARGGAVVALGVPPSAPETGFGYIQRGSLIADRMTKEAWTIQRFCEKPLPELAQAFLDSGDYLWNSGVFVLRASVWLAALQRCRPDISSAVASAWVGRSEDMDFVRVSASAFARTPSESVDYAVMEHLAPAQGQAAAGLPAGAVVALDAGWSDVGSWSAVWDHLPKDARANAQQGDVLLIDSRDSLVVSQHRLVACCGIDGLVIVETPDAVLVMPREKAQQVKAVVEHLREHGRSEWQVHQKVHRPWGWFDSVDSGERFQVKRILVLPGAALSLQMHHHRAEHWIVVKGTAQVTCDDKTFLLTENESTYIPLGKSHRLENPGKVALEMIEVQSGGYLGEDDIVRFDDVYGRA
ncbi:mannose-1-phosphate guanylyltransferase/mannose-6-phosphate isomerase [Hydrogenophaga sp.]|uniref:mannose-1-phosphate guanylyltransferase/mannose-6-phosphate isomerase n=1 Tax=Hydrogenophaga sp. TaxID=1904254 RepID=UPI0034585711